MLIDVHAHLSGEEYEELGGLPALLARMRGNGVERVIASGFDYESSLRSMQLAEEYGQVYFCAGFHPSELARFSNGDFERIKELCKHEKCVAVGEIGLDYHFENNPPKQTQKEAFFRQLEIADELSLPVVIHSRDAAEDTYELLETNRHLLRCGGLMHCYSYSPEMLTRFEMLGLSFSFGGTSTFKNAKKVVASVECVPAHRILSETDCPYLTPTPFRGVFPNEPKNVKYVVEKLAEIRGVSVEEMEKQIENNAYALFRKLR
ncbi:MAG: TatD family hydrolase [Clostridia bacterium]|nr:TatD family hydrolase [Clostridia bacterium]